MDPVDTSNELLRDVVQLMAHSMNRTVLPVLTTSPSISEDAVVRINVFWFLSLALSLCAALVAILCKQWLREFKRDVGQSTEMALAVRHIRFQGLHYWKVDTIVTSVPVALQVALACFLIGVVDLLWNLQPIVAYFVTLVAGVTLTFYLATTFLPVMQYAYICLRCCGGPDRVRNFPSRRAFMQAQCSFKSAQAWLVLCIFQPII
ncbi:hypothetical protein AURDEDRAFT_58758 [Auricularia subglabra TFB-10046 SS5]|nr:hypothetical protein AURDEDRAFT_58758 [Auricularia subglabra TFB-10046 SS5]